MSTIMRRRNGLTAPADLVEVMGGSGLEVGVFETPSILKPASRPVIPQRLNCSSVLAHPPFRAQRAPAVAGSFIGPNLPSRNVRASVAIGGKADMPQTCQNRRK